SPYPERTIYFDVDEANGHMLADDSYDAFVLVPLFVAMFHKQDLRIRGKISKRLFQNVKWYIQRIYCDYSPDLSPVNVIVDGTIVNDKRGKIVGTGISCGIDSLSTIYDHFIREDDPDYKVNALFYFNHDMHNHRKDSSGQVLYKNLLARNRSAAQDLNLPLYSLESNLYVFNDVIIKLRKKFISFSYVSMDSCILALGGVISRYYISNAWSYSQTKKFDDAAHDYDFAEFCDSYFVPLIQTERTELIIDGCQYRRVDKLKRIVDWDIAQKYLNVCWRYTPDGSNCGVCIKCLRVQLTLEIIGKLDKFAAVFDIDRYNRDSMGFKIRSLQNYGVEPLDTQNVDFAKEHNFPMPECHKCFTLGKRVMIFGE
ncbi:MAG: hypothetical protein IJ774_00730, partial [Selenomonadaceae bacterium]|nr:hypothetical protein [Selenomonadaceae bacterium]